MKLPENYSEKVTHEGLLSGLELYWIAFWELRSSTPDEDPIPFSERECWARTYRLDAEQKALLHGHLGAMDAEYRVWFRKRTAGKSTGTGTGLGRRGKGKAV